MEASLFHREMCRCTAETQLKSNRSVKCDPLEQSQESINTNEGLRIAGTGLPSHHQSPAVAAAELLAAVRALCVRAWVTPVERRRVTYKNRAKVEASGTLPHSPCLNN